MGKSGNWYPGISLRLSRLFDSESQKGVIVAMDHSFGGVHSGLENPAETLAKILEGDPDGVILTPGTARQFQSSFSGKGSPAVILSIDYVLFHPYPGAELSIEEQGLASSVETALQLGADAVKLLMIFGREDPGMQARNFDTIGALVEECHQWGLPVMVEPTTWGQRFKDKDKKKPQLLRDMARIAFEFGADVVKSDYPEDPADFKVISSSCPVPVFVLGGAQQEDGKLLQDVKAVVEAGAAGVTFGRNVWQHPDPGAMIRGLKHCVYRGDLDAGMREIQTRGEGR